MLPQYLSAPEPLVRTDPNVRRQQILGRQQEISNNFLIEDIIGDFANFVSNFESKLYLDGYNVFKNSNKIII